MDQSFVLVSSTARESRIFITVILWVLVAFPLLGLICWLAANAFGRTAASTVGAGLSIALIVVVVILFSRKERYTLTVAAEAIRVVDDRGRLIASLAPQNLELEIASHVYVGRPTIRIPVVVLQDKTHELTIGANSSEQPPVATRRVSAPRFLVEPADLPRLIAAIDAVRRSAQ